MGYLREGGWRHHVLQHWLIMALIVSLVGQTVFMPASHELFDMGFDLAHILKKLSYILVLSGLLINMLFLYRQAEKTTQLQHEIDERKLLEQERARYHQQLEKEVEKRTADLHHKTTELETSNKDLEAFSYSVSHDLRAPLRAIDGFISIIKEDYGDKLDEEGLRLFSVVRDNARKMGSLIEDVLHFSRAGRHELEPVVINMNALVDEVWKSLSEQRGKLAYQFERSELPDYKGDTHAIRQVWQNLLSNAIKFSRNSQPPIIQVMSKKEANQILFLVKDNGAGFNPEYANKLFLLFQRLHGMDEFEGTGVGLAVVKRFIQKHGGIVKAESNVNQGATFSFILPEIKLSGES